MTFPISIVWKACPLPLKDKRIGSSHLVRIPSGSPVDLQLPSLHVAMPRLVRLVRLARPAGKVGTITSAKRRDEIDMEMI